MSSSTSPLPAPQTEAPLPPPIEPPQGDHERTRKAAGGGLAVLFAKVFFIVTGLVQQALLPRAIGLANYGALSRILATSNVLNNVVVSGSLQSASRAVASSPGQEPAVLRRLMRVQLAFAIALGAGFAALSPLLADLQKAPHIVPGLVAMALVLAVYTVYAPLVGSLNGRGLFTRQAALDVVAASLRTTALIGAGYLYVRTGRDGASGSATGAALAVCCILPLAILWSGLFRRVAATDAATEHSSFRSSVYVKALLGLAAAQFFINVLMQVDLMMVGRFLAQGAEAAYGPGEHAATDADEWVGVYRACQLFAFLPFQLLFAVTQVLFPMLARAKAEGDHQGVRRSVERGLRLGLIVTGLLVSVVVAMPRSLLGLAFPPVIAERGASTLHLLALGQGVFAILGLCTTVLASLGHERRAALITGGASVVVAGLGFVWVAGAPYGNVQLEHMAMATSLGMSVAVLLAGISVRRLTQSFAPLRSVLRVAGAVALAFAAGSFEPHVGKLITLVLPIPVVLAYLLVLIVTGELGRADLQLVRGLLRRKA